MDDEAFFRQSIQFALAEIAVRVVSSADADGTMPTQCSAVCGAAACFIRASAALGSPLVRPFLSPTVCRSYVRRARRRHGRFAVDLQPAAAAAAAAAALRSSSAGSIVPRRCGADCQEWEKRPRGVESAEHSGRADAGTDVKGSRVKREGECWETVRGGEE